MLADSTYTGSYKAAKALPDGLLTNIAWHKIGFSRTDTIGQTPPVPS